MLVGYARVSTDDQNPELQRQALKKIGCWSGFSTACACRGASRFDFLSGTTRGDEEHGPP